MSIWTQFRKFFRNKSDTRSISLGFLSKVCFSRTVTAVKKRAARRYSWANSFRLLCECVVRPTRVPGKPFWGWHKRRRQKCARYFSKRRDKGSARPERNSQISSGGPKMNRIIHGWLGPVLSARRSVLVAVDMCAHSLLRAPRKMRNIISRVLSEQEPMPNGIY